MGQIRFVLLLSRQGKVRLAKWYTTYTQKERSKVCADSQPLRVKCRTVSTPKPADTRPADLQITRDITPTILGRTAKLCNFLDYQDYKAWPWHK